MTKEQTYVIVDGVFKPSTLYWRGDLDLQGTDVTKLPEGLGVGGNLCLQGTNIAKLPKDLWVVGNLYLQGTNVTKLPKGLKVGGNLPQDFTLGDLGVLKDFETKRNDVVGALIDKTVDATEGVKLLINGYKNAVSSDDLEEAEDRLQDLDEALAALVQALEDL